MAHLVSVCLSNSGFVQSVLDLSHRHRTIHPVVLSRQVLDRDRDCLAMMREQSQRQVPWNQILVNQPCHKGVLTFGEAAHSGGDHLAIEAR